jgi:peptidoglycan hydrolase CwlO-like protein
MGKWKSRRFETRPGCEKLIKSINILINQVEDLREEIDVKNADLDRMEGEIRNLKARLKGTS